MKVNLIDQVRTNQDSTNFRVEALHPSLTIEGGSEVVKRVVLLAIYVLLDALMRVEKFTEDGTDST